MAGLGSECAMDAEGIGTLQEIVQTFHTGCARDLILSTWHIRIIPAHVKAEALRSTGCCLPNAAETEDGQCKFLQPLYRGKATCIPPGLWGNGSRWGSIKAT